MTCHLQFLFCSRRIRENTAKHCAFKRWEKPFSTLLKFSYRSTIDRPFRSKKSLGEILSWSHSASPNPFPPPPFLARTIERQIPLRTHAAAAAAFLPRPTGRTGGGEKSKGKKMGRDGIFFCEEGKMEAGENVWHCESWNTGGGFSFEV